MSKFTSFLLGGLVGAGLALAFSPNTGEKNRALVAEKANALAEEAMDFGAGFPGSAQDALKAAYSKGAELVGGAQSATGGLVNDAQSKVKEVTGKTESDPDELREKIEAARQRIAAQVMENAEKAKETAADTVKETAEETAKKADEVAEKADEAKHAK